MIFHFTFSGTTLIFGENTFKKAGPSQDLSQKIGLY